MTKVTLTVLRDDDGQHRLVKQEEGQPGSSECGNLSLKRNYNRASFYRAVALEIMKWHGAGYSVDYKDAAPESINDETIFVLGEALNNLVTCFPEDDPKKIERGVKEAFRELNYSQKQIIINVANVMASYIRSRKH